jgi:GGDEF domain-containing protein
MTQAAAIGGTVDTFLGRALTDPATGLPNIPYFCLIQNWEERRARRRKTIVRVLRLQVLAGGEAVRRALTWRLCQELRTSDLIASDGKNEFRILLTSPDAENIEAVGVRIDHLLEGVNTASIEGEERLHLQVELEPPNDSPDAKGPCDPCDEHALASENTLFR